MTFYIRPITPSDANQIANWQYADEYAVYSFDADKSAENVNYLIDPGNQIYAIDNAAGALVAYCSFGPDGQVPGGDYSLDALDIGVSLRPDLTGQGHGVLLTEAIIAFGIELFRPKQLRVTIAAFNKRARRVIEKSAFYPVNSFQNPKGDPFIIYVRDVSTAV